MNEKAMIKKLEHMISADKLIHSIAVKDTAIELAGLNNCSKDKARIAGLLHDCAKNIKEDKILEMCAEFGITIDNICKMQPKLLHGPIGAKLATKLFGIKDKDILDAIYYHTIAKEDMSTLCKIIYLADFIEPNRNFPGVDMLRTVAYINLDKALLLTINSSIKKVIEMNRIIHPNTILARNYILINRFYS